MQNFFKSLTSSLSYLMVFHVIKKQIARYQPVNNSKITKIQK